MVGSTKEESLFHGMPWKMSPDVSCWAAAKHPGGPRRPVGGLGCFAAAPHDTSGDDSRSIPCLLL